MLGCARKALSSRRPLAARFTTLRARQCALFVAHVAQALAQCLEVIEPSLINFGMMTAQDHPVFVIAEDAAFELAGDGHELPSWLRRINSAQKISCGPAQPAVGPPSCVFGSSDRDPHRPRVRITGRAAM